MFWAKPTPFRTEQRWLVERGNRTHFISDAPSQRGVEHCWGACRTLAGGRPDENARNSFWKSRIDGNRIQQSLKRQTRAHICLPFWQATTRASPGRRARSGCCSFASDCGRRRVSGGKHFRNLCSGWAKPVWCSTFTRRNDWSTSLGLVDRGPAPKYLRQR